MKGLHIIADLYNCQKGELLVSSGDLRELCVKACTGVGLTVLGDHFYQFDAADGTQSGGATGAVVVDAAAFDLCERPLQAVDEPAPRAPPSPLRRGGLSNPCMS